MVEHSSANPKVPGLIPARSHTWVMDYDEACIMHLLLEWSKRLWVYRIFFLSPMHKMIPDSYLK